MRESKLEKYLREQIEARYGGMALKFTSPGKAGVPDRIVITPAGVHFVELKAHDGRLSHIQVEMQSRMMAAGARVFTLYGEYDVQHYLGLLEQRANGRA